MMGELRMTSTIAWLDTSVDEQRRIRELIAMFAQPGALDELGIGQIRDVMSNALFPGTSVLFTRARYLLLVPWSFMSTRGGARSATDAKARAERSERILIETLRGTGQRGVIGAVAGAKVKTLPSAIYWHGLQTFGILCRDVAPDGLSLTSIDRDAVDELPARARDDWYPTIPPVPEGFPGKLDGGLDLKPEEAVWLRERILNAVPDSLVAHMVAADQHPDPGSGYPWTEPICASVTGRTRDILQQAHLFSLIMKGASTLYAVLVGEAYEREGFNAVAEPAEGHRESFRSWATDLEEERHKLDNWDLGGFWRFVRAENPRVSPLTTSFVTAWVDVVRQENVSTVLDDEGARGLIAGRERAAKGRQARLTNSKLLGMWGGGGPAGLDYRWPNVKTLVSDIYEGVHRVRA
jgi:hypothetical protein